MTRTHLAPLNPESAYRVPWHFERGALELGPFELGPFELGHDAGAGSGAHCFTLRNLGSERLTRVTFNLYGSGLMPTSAPSTLEPGDALEIVISGANLERDTIGLVRWFRPSGLEYLWRVSF
jgi:hypothetical protein